MIYKEALVQELGVFITATGVPELPLLRVSKLLRKETITIYFGCNVFYIPTPDYDSSIAFHWTARCRKLCKEHEISIQQVGLTGTKTPHWGNLVLWLKRLYDGSIGWKCKFSLPHASEVRGG